MQSDWWAGSTAIRHQSGRLAGSRAFEPVMDGTSIVHGQCTARTMIAALLEAGKRTPHHYGITAEQAALLLQDRMRFYALVLQSTQAAMPPWLCACRSPSVRPSEGWGSVWIWTAVFQAASPAVHERYHICACTYTVKAEEGFAQGHASSLMTHRLHSVLTRKCPHR